MKKYPQNLNDSLALFLLTMQKVRNLENTEVFFLFPTTNSENKSKSLWSQARRPNYIVIDIVYLGVKRF